MPARCIRDSNIIKEFGQRIEKLETRYDQLYMQVNPVCQPKSHYTRGQDVEVYTGNYVDYWQKALYITTIIKGMHLVFIDKSGKLAQFPDTHIRSITQTTEG